MRPNNFQEDTAHLFEDDTLFVDCYKQNFLSRQVCNEDGELAHLCHQDKYLRISLILWISIPTLIYKLDGDVPASLRYLESMGSCKWLKGSQLMSVLQPSLLSVRLSPNREYRLSFDRFIFVLYLFSMTSFFLEHKNRERHNFTCVHYKYKTYYRRFTVCILRI